MLLCTVPGKQGPRGKKEQDPAPSTQDSKPRADSAWCTPGAPAAVKAWLAGRPLPARGLWGACPDPPAGLGRWGVPTYLPSDRLMPLKRG